jgi:small subunit ribosomal protein S16
MVRIRLTRRGKRDFPTYRIVVADARSGRNGRFIEDLGYYNPHRNPPEIKVAEEKLLAWLEKGAQPTKPIEKIMRKLGLENKKDTEVKEESND